ncbi:MAG: L-serine ammonia-lyase, iron-sulfur-dependent, subunit beta, partial [Mogibacterium sp.]|nr:L-serine ammonia-lyase, iron-sulfur-dependent, subunit beta [Mogibacterium sp.]
MPKNYIGIFDVMGPAMIGPSSSHTSGAASIAWMARQVFSARPVKVTYTLYGSFAETYKGHGTDRALIGGMLGYRSNDARIRNAYEDAKKEGLTVDFI